MTIDKKLEELYVIFEKRNQDMWIKKNAICYIKADGSYIDIHTVEGTKKASHTLNYWTEKLDSSKFIRIHKSYVVNIDYIKCARNEIVMDSGDVLPIGRTFKKNLKKKLLIKQWQKEERKKR